MKPIAIQNDVSDFPWLRQGFPALVLAPMEGVTDAPMRALLSEGGAFALCVSEFLRVSHEVPPSHVFRGHVPELAAGCRTPSGVPVADSASRWRPRENGSSRPTCGPARRAWNRYQLRVPRCNRESPRWRSNAAQVPGSNLSDRFAIRDAVPPHIAGLGEAYGSAGTISIPSTQTRTARPKAAPRGSRFMAGPSFKGMRRQLIGDPSER